MRANFTACCEYPAIVIGESEFSTCSDECEAVGLSRDLCCLLRCVCNKLGIYHDAPLESSDEKLEMFPEGFINSFLMSVNNDEQWVPVVTQSTLRCFDQFADPSLENETCGLPGYFYLVLDCTHKELYLKCPKWNPSELAECKFTYDYMIKCYDTDYYYY